MIKIFTEISEIAQAIIVFPVIHGLGLLDATFSTGADVGCSDWQQRRIGSSDHHVQLQQRVGEAGAGGTFFHSYLKSIIRSTRSTKSIRRMLWRLPTFCLRISTSEEPFSPSRTLLLSWMVLLLKMVMIWYFLKITAIILDSWGDYFWCFPCHFWGSDHSNCRFYGEDHGRLRYEEGIER